MAADAAGAEECREASVHCLLTAARGGFPVAAPPPRRGLAPRARSAAGFMRRCLRANWWPRMTRRELSQHGGCVNTVQWGDGGRFLVSGSDDTTVCLWDGARDYALARQLRTGHRANIFCARLLEGGAVATCARDGQFRLTDAETGQRDCVFMGRSSMQKFVMRSPQSAIVASEDGTVRCLDLRQGHRQLAQPLVNLTNAMDLTTVALHPLREGLLAVAGGDAFVRVYDMRRGAAGGGGAECVGRLLPHRKMSAGAHVTGVAFSSNGERLAAIYSRDDVYVFDGRDALRGVAHADPGAAAHTPLPQRPRRRRYCSAALADEVRTRSSDNRATDGDTTELDIPASTLADGLSDAALSLPPPAGVASDGGEEGAVAGSVAAAAAAESGDDAPATGPVATVGESSECPASSSTETETEEESDKSDGDGSDLRAFGIREWMARAGRLPPSARAGPKRLGHTACLTGHRSMKTVKEVCFMGPDGRWVLGGSDCGGLFVWRASTGALEHVLVKADAHITNGAAPHPSGLPVLASCGIDAAVKLWAPGKPAWQCPSAAELAKRHSSLCNTNARIRRQPVTWRSLFLDDSDGDSDRGA
eukprot:TRINITY_DN1548_c0_g2_i1.p1 TRINITY_DN1548_c0_g2~~TRINITY_DN1548_c0_g2_i1.p1  ORF type:complete len:590 (+),score=180.21 TRINITY_DN1548_c0_g2_i1:86-1855(+)